MGRPKKITQKAPENEAVPPPAEAMPQTLLNMDQVASILGLGKTKVYYLMMQDGLPVIRFGRSVRVDPVSLQRWIRNREQSA